MINNKKKLGILVFFLTFFAFYDILLAWQKAINNQYY